MKRNCIPMFCTVLAATLAAGSCSAGHNSGPQLADLWSAFPHIKCMANVLRKMPDVSNVVTGVVNHDGKFYGLVQYYYAAPVGYSPSGYVRFNGQPNDDGSASYSATVGGFFDPDAVYSGYGLGKIQPVWKKQCNVTILVLSV